MKKPEDIERCCMVDFRQISDIKIPDCKRLYFGHETCEKRLPSYDEAEELLAFADSRKMELTFVTPFLTAKGFEHVVLFLEKIISVIPHLEIVLSDWGLLNWVTTHKIGTPVISRFLVGQQVDFRLSKFYKDYPSDWISPELSEHISACSLLKTKTLDLLNRLGIYRFELNNVVQSVKLPDDIRLHFSLHVPFVPLTIFRWCPEDSDFNHTRKGCNRQTCGNCEEEWQTQSLEQTIWRRDNALYYSNSDNHTHILRHPAIDRLIYS